VSLGSQAAPAIQYETAHLDLLKAIPELQTPFDRQVADWDNFGGEPPGQYLVFQNLLETWLQVLLSAPTESTGRSEALRRTMTFGERLLSSSDSGVRDLGSEAYVYPFVFSRNRAVADLLGGPELKAILHKYHSAPIENENTDFIDIWGVREFLAPLLPGLEIYELAGISHPADHYELSSLDEARGSDDGAVVLCDFGHTYVYMVARAAMIDTNDSNLQEAAQALAPHFRFMHEDGVLNEHEVRSPRARYFTIPRHERLWNMTEDGEPHKRFDSDLWISNSLTPYEERIQDLLRGTTDSLVV